MSVFTTFVLCSRKVFHLFCIFLSIRLQITVIYFYSQRTQDLMLFLMGLYLCAGSRCSFNLLTFNDVIAQKWHDKILVPAGSPFNPKSAVMGKHRLKITALREHLSKCTL